LKKKGRLPWVNKEERRKQSNNQITSGSGGRFWHNPSDLVEGETKITLGNMTPWEHLTSGCLTLGCRTSNR
jgi:hypothetical protein